MISKEKGGTFLSVLLIFLTGINILASISTFWMLFYWGNITTEEIIFTLSMSLSGVSNSIFLSFGLWVLIPVAIILIFIWILYLKTKNIWIFSFIWIVSLILMIYALFLANKKVGFIEYLTDHSQYSSYIEDNYVDPSQVELTYPAEKQNLIMIYVESLEDTYADAENGGWYEENYIPRLTDLAKEGDNFSGDDSRLRGAYSMPGTTWTIGGLFATSSGLPLQIPVKDNELGKTGSFFPGITTLGNILENAGYNQVYLIGSDAEFGGRKEYYTEHGNFHIEDYMYALENNWIPSDYYEWWGFEDAKLYTFAKERLTELANQSEPFNLTLLTADTHFTDGYICDLCHEDYDEQYANVIKCADSQLVDFVDWIKEQPFYSNTTVIITGDHPTMDPFCDEVDESVYQRNVYNLILNSRQTVSDPSQTRDYTTFDLFPTTLSALGVDIPGNRLGLGTNLYSDEPTLVERDGIFTVIEELDKNSEFMTRLSDVNKNSKEVLIINDELPTADIVCNYDNDILSIDVSDIDNIDNDIASVRVTASSNGSFTSKKSKMEKIADDEYILNLDISSWKNKAGKITIDAIDSKKISYHIGEIDGSMTLKKSDFSEYLDVLCQMRETSDLTIYMVACGDDAVDVIDETIMEKLSALGISTPLDEARKGSYYSIIDNNRCIENFSYENLIFDEVTPKNTKVHLESQGIEYHDYCSIQLNGIEYAPGKEGLNIVVYDNKAKKVIDASVFTED